MEAAVPAAKPRQETKRVLLVLSVLLAASAVSAGIVAAVMLLKQPHPSTNLPIVTMKNVKVSLPSVADSIVSAAVDLRETSSRWHFFSGPGADGRCSHILHTGAGLRYSFTSTECSFHPTKTAACSFRRVDEPTYADPGTTIETLLTTNATAPSTMDAIDVTTTTTPFTPPAICATAHTTRHPEQGEASAHTSAAHHLRDVLELRIATETPTDLHDVLRSDLLIAAVAGVKDDASSAPEALMGGETIPLASFWTDYSFLVSLHDVRHRCGGTLIAPDWVLTAAHCVRQNHFWFRDNDPVKEIRIGMYSNSWPAWYGDLWKNVGIGAATRTPKKIIVHPGYVPNPWGVGPHDIALIKLDAPVYAAGLKKPGHLAASGGMPLFDSPDEDSIYRQVGTTQLTVAGWGALTGGASSQDMPRHASMPYASCKAYDTERGLEAEGVYEGDVCAGAVGINAARHCNMDSGGPLMADYMNNPGFKMKVLVGVVVKGVTCGSEHSANFPGIYAGVGYHRSWIQQTMHWE